MGPGRPRRITHRRTPRCPSRSGPTGQATVEFALCLPLIVLALALVLQVALLLRTQLLLVEAAREGARAAARDPHVGTARSAAAAVPGLDPARLEVRIDETAGSDPTVTVHIGYRATTDVPLVGALLPDPDLTARVSMRIEPGSEP